MIKYFKKLTLLVLLCGLQSVGSATPGGVDVAGCHQSAKIGYHCHPERATGSGNADGSRSDRDKRLKRECRGRPNAGACLGYTGK